MQGKNKIFLDLLENITAFKEKMKLWIGRMERGRMAAFPDLNLFIEDEDLNVSELIPLFLEHLRLFLVELEKYIPRHNYTKMFSWVRLPFEVSAVELDCEDDTIAEQLIELQSKNLWKTRFQSVTLTQFWTEVCESEPQLSQLCSEASNALLPFPTTYLCESGFSVLAFIKSNRRSKLNPEDDMRCALSTIEPDIDYLVNQCQGQGSH
jgi:hypothetical protein